MTFIEKQDCCPYCGSQSISVGQPRDNGYEVKYECYDYDCGESWDVDVSISKAKIGQTMKSFNEWFMATYKKSPQFSFEQEDGDFHCKVEVAGRTFSGVGTSKKIAKVSAFRSVKDFVDFAEECKCCGKKFVTYNMNGDPAPEVSDGICPDCEYEMENE